MGFERKGLLSEEEQNRLAERIGKGDREALDELIVSNIGLCIFVCGRYAKRFEERLDDLFEIGCEKLVEAANKWNPKRSMFSTYATNMIEWGLKTYLRGRNMIIELPKRASSIRRAWKKSSRDGNYSNEDIIKFKKGDEKYRSVTWDTFKSAIETGIGVSLDEYVGSRRGDRGKGFCLGNLIDVDKGESFTENVDNRIDYDVIVGLFDKLLDKRESYIMRERFVEEISAEEIAGNLRLSVARVNQIKNESIKRIRMYLSVED